MRFNKKGKIAQELMIIFIPAEKLNSGVNNQNGSGSGSRSGSKPGSKSGSGSGSESGCGPGWRRERGMRREGSTRQASKQAIKRIASELQDLKGEAGQAGEEGRG